MVINMNMNFTKLNLEDIEFLVETRNLVAEEYLHDSRKFSVEEAKNWFLNTSPDYYVIWLNDTKIGYFRTSNYSNINKNIYIGADIHPNFQGKGYAYQAYLKFIPFLFGEYNLNKISLEVLATNTRAIKLYYKLGFFLEGTKRQEILKNSKYVDSHIMSMLRSEYKHG